MAEEKDEKTAEEDAQLLRRLLRPKQKKEEGS